MMVELFRVASVKSVIAGLGFLGLRSEFPWAAACGEILCGGEEEVWPQVQGGTQVQRGGGHRCRAEGDTGAGDEAALRGPVPTCRLVMGISVNK